jgi:tetratricopeptide (TPR) repeat protein
MLKILAPLTLLRTGVGALLLALAAGSALAQADDVQEAAKLLKSGQHAQALDRVNKVLSQKPRDPQARFLKGLILTEQGNTREAIDIFTKLTQDFPELPEPYNNLAVIYASQGQYERARSALEQSIRTHPSYATAYENLGDVYAKLASQAYDKALQLDSSNAGAQNKFANWSAGREPPGRRSSRRSLPQRSRSSWPRSRPTSRRRLRSLRPSRSPRPKKQSLPRRPPPANPRRS